MADGMSENYLAIRLSMLFNWASSTLIRGIWSCRLSMPYKWYIPSTICFDNIVQRKRDKKNLLNAFTFCNIALSLLLLAPQKSWRAMAKWALPVSLQLHKTKWFTRWKRRGEKRIANKNNTSFWSDIHSTPIILMSMMYETMRKRYISMNIQIIHVTRWEVKRNETYEAAYSLYNFFSQRVIIIYQWVF